MLSIISALWQKNETGSAGRLPIVVFLNGKQEALPSDLHQNTHQIQYEYWIAVLEM